jgi:hypothetical protein
MDKENLVYIQNAVLCFIKKSERMSFAGKWVKLKIIKLNNISQIQKDKHHIFSHMWNLDGRKGHEYKKGAICQGKPAWGFRDKKE